MMIDLPMDVPNTHESYYEYQIPTTANENPSGFDFFYASTSFPFAFQQQIVGSIVKIFPPENVNTYEELRRTPLDEQNIRTLITHLGTYSWGELWSNRKALNALGDDVRPVHPLKFLGYIFSHPDLKKHMNTVLNDFMIRSNFVKGLAEKMEAELKRPQDNVYKFLDGFADECHVPLKSVKTYVDQHRWKELLEYLAKA